MSVESGDEKIVTLLPSNIAMKQPLDMTLFSITDYVLRNASDPRNGLLVTITMKRKIMSEMMTDDDLLPLPSPHDDHLCHHLLQTFFL